jgi:hypothetical protein
MLEVVSWCILLAAGTVVGALSGGRRQGNLTRPHLFSRTTRPKQIARRNSIAKRVKKLR